jgi:protoporphyrin/coproporphyrin ferrochelatase
MIGVVGAKHVPPGAVGEGRYDALLLVSFGGPEGPDEVLPFLRNVTRGRGVPDERLAEVAGHYDRFGGRSPINDQNRALLAALRSELAPMPVYWGNRNWRPTLAEALAAMRDDGITRAACFVTSAFASYSGCRQYREDLAEAAAEVGDGVPELAKLRLYFDHPGFVEPLVDNVTAALAELPAARRDGAAMVFVAHSVPMWQARTSGPDGGAYPAQLAAVGAVIAERVGARTGWRGAWEIAYSSRSGPPSVPWLEPDIGDRLAALGPAAAVVVPIGFVSDHLEVVYDLDVMAAGRAAAAGVEVRRAATVGTDPRFVRMVAGLLAERAAPAAPRPALTALPPARDICPRSCCAARVWRPTVAGTPADAEPPARLEELGRSGRSRGHTSFAQE